MYSRGGLIVMLCRIPLAGETQLGKGPGEAPGPAPCRVLRDQHQPRRQTHLSEAALSHESAGEKASEAGKGSDKGSG